VIFKHYGARFCKVSVEVHRPVKSSHLPLPVHCTGHPAANVLMYIAYLNTSLSTSQHASGCFAGGGFQIERHRLGVRVSDLEANPVNLENIAFYGIAYIMQQMQHSHIQLGPPPPWLIIHQGLALLASCF
jgi:hypothetical protein